MTFCNSRGMDTLSGGGNAIKIVSVPTESGLL